MTLKTLKAQIKTTEQQLAFYQKNYLEKRIAYQHYAPRLKYCWMLLPISAFVVGFKKNTALLTTVVVFLRSNAFYWLRQNVQSKLVMAILGQHQ